MRFRLLGCILVKICIVSAACIYTAGCSSGGEDIAFKIKSLDPHNKKEVDELADAIKLQSRSLPMKVVNMWLGDNHDEYMQGRKLAGELDELVIRAAIDACPDARGMEKAQLMYLAVEQHLEQRRALAARLSEMLNDKSLIPLSVSDVIDPPEETPSPRRMCDEGYLFLCMLLNTDKNETALASHEDAYLKMSFKKRDALIRKAVSSQVWSLWLRKD